MASVRIGDVGDFLQFEVAERGPVINPTDIDTADIQAELQLGDLTARLPVSPHYAAGFRDLVAYFDGLERDWRGWSGVRTWESLDHELRFEARHDGHIQIKVELERQFWWTATGELTLEPGEQLSQVAAELRRCLGGD